jgi:hypothetical protein
MRPNEPANVVHTVRFAASLRNEPLEQLAATSTANAVLFFASLATASLQPGPSIAFEAVVVTVPTAAARFVLEPISSGRSAAGRGALLTTANALAPAP